MKRVVHFFLLVTLVSSGGWAQLSLDASEEHLEIRNRVLANVNGTAITAMDLAERLDLTFAEYYPEYLGQSEARFEYFRASWKPMLQQLVNDKLIQFDALERGMPISRGEVREAIEERFGPDVLKNLDSVGLSYDKAYELMHAEIMVRRMSGYRINSKAYMAVGPAAIKAAYRKAVEDLEGKATWNYRLVSFRAEDSERALAAAHKVHQMLKERDGALDGLSEELAQEDWDSSVSVSVSEDFERSVDDISDVHREVVEGLAANSFSEPVIQEGRSGKVVRIYFVNEITHAEIPDFADVEDRVRNRLLGERVQQESERYFAYLRKHYDVEEMLGNDCPYVWIQ